MFWGPSRSVLGPESGSVSNKEVTQTLMKCFCETCCGRRTLPMKPVLLTALGGMWADPHFHPSGGQKKLSK